jgi:hypothetical protein
MTKYGETNCPECRGTNYGHYSHCSKYGGEKRGHKHAALMAQYAQDALETDKPDEKLRAMWVNYAPIVGGVIEFARAIEAAHGIGAEHDAR